MWDQEGRVDNVVLFEPLASQRSWNKANWGILKKVRLKARERMNGIEG